MKEEFFTKKPNLKTEFRSLPVFFHQEVNETVYERFNGTCFVISLQDNFFIVTADHVLTRQNGEEIEDKEIMFVDINYSGKPFHLNQRIKIVKDVNEYDDSYKDLTIFPIDIDSQEPDHQRLIRDYAYYINIANVPRLIKGEELVVFGYPTNLSEELKNKYWTDNEQEHHHIVVVGLTGMFEGNSDLLHISKIKFNQKYILGGISGSPVYCKRGGRFILCGILVMASGNIPGDTAHFININVLYSALNVE
jgi:hypothetical protein